ncbi:MAG: bacterio-opsin activator domain-containing protein [Salinirussus sp.]
MPGAGSGGTDSDSGVVEVRFELSDPSYPFIGLTEQLDCRVELQKMLPRGREGYAEFFRIAGADPERILAIAEENDLVEPRLVAGNDESGLFEFVVTGFCPAQDLAEDGAIPQEVVGENGTGTIIVEIPPSENPSTVIDRFLDDHPSASLEAKVTKERSTPLFTAAELEQAVDRRLTDRQQELLHAAYESGYYEQPRETTGEELANRFDISAATLSQHLGAAERKLIAILMQDRTGPASV